MRKSTLFISAALTSMMLAMLYGVVSAYQAITSSVDTFQINPGMVSQQPNQLIEAVPSADLPAVPMQLTPQQAAQMAALTIGRTDLYSVETTTWKGLQAYLVTFSSGDLVYIGVDGQILEISKIQPTVVTVQSNNGGSGGNRGNNDSGGEHHGDEHESDEHENDDD